MTIQQRYPMLSLDKCSGISGYYADEKAAELNRFEIDKSSAEFKTLCDLMYSKEYRRGLNDLLPRSRRIHRVEAGEFQWEVYFYFEDVQLPDGNYGSKEMLRIQYWYGDLDIYFDGERISCYTNDQEKWAKEVFKVIRKEYN